jgi:glutathione S-transferase
MILVGRLMSPFVRRSAILLDMLGLPFQMQPLSATAEQQALRAINPIGRVPALIDGDHVLVDSVAIALTLCDRHDPDGRVWPRGGPALSEALQTLMLANGALEKFVAGYYERRHRPAEKVHEPWVAQCWAQAQGGLAALERGPAVVRASAEGPPDLVDIALATMTSFFPRIDAGFFSAQDHPCLETIRQRCEAHPAFRRHAIPD